MHDSTLKEKVVKSHLAGVPTRTISKKFNVNRRSVQRWVQKASEALEEVKPLPTVKDKLDVIHQIETGMDVSSLARTLRISDQTIRNWVSLKNDFLALYSLQEELNPSEENSDMGIIKDQIEKQNLKKENEFLKAKVAYLEELMKLSNIPAESFKKKLDMMPSLRSSKEDSSK